ncbi:MAG: TlpA family protein disulfide reductase [Actinomycetota bacterium]
MSDYLPILLIFALASTYGIWYQASRGKVKAKKNRATKNPLLENEVGGEFGSRATFIQFSSAFCTPCRATRALLSDITADLDDVKHIEIDAEKNLDLVRKLDIRSTPTTLVLDRQGIEIGRAIGAPKRAEILATLDALK